MGKTQMPTAILLSPPVTPVDPALSQAIEAINAGDRVSGKRLLFKVLRSDPDNEQAWLSLASTYRAAEQRAMCLQRVLEINPNNQAARSGLAGVGTATTPSSNPNANVPAVLARSTSLPAALPGPTASPAPAWNERDMNLATRRRVLLLVALMAIVWGTVIGWILIGPAIPEAAAQPLAPGISLTVLLSPLIVAAAAVERALESIFNIIENNWHAVVAYLGRGMRWLKSAETEVQRSRQWLADASGLYNQRMGDIVVEHEQPQGGFTEAVLRQMDEAKSILTLAEQRLAEAEKNLANLTSSASYKKAKATASIVLGLLLGVVIARLTSLQMFALLGLSGVPAKFDVLLTGLVIGSGSYPVHTFVGLLQQVKDTLDSAKGTLARFGQPK
jgi:hypothetical protein